MADEIASLVVKITGDASDLEKTIGQVERELNSLSGSMQKNTSATNSNTSANRENSSSQKESSQSQKEKTRSTEENTKKTDENTKSHQKNTKTLKETGKAWKEYGEGIDSVAKPVQVASAALATGGVFAAKMAIDFEDSFASVKKTVDGTPEQLESIKKAIIDMSTVGINGHSAIPMTTTQLNELAAAGGQLGIETDNIAKFTETMAMLGTATNLSGEAGAQTLAQFMNVANVAQDDISRLGSAIVDLGNNFATNEAKIADMAMNIGATSTQMGISAQDTLAYATALSSMGVEAQAGGSAVSRILMDIQSAVSAGGAKLNTFAKVSGKTSKEFASEWKNDASKAFKSFLDGLSKSEDIVKSLQDLGFNNIYDVQALQRFASEKGLGLLTEALERSSNAWEENIALQNEFDDKAETTASKLLVTKNNLVEAARSIGETLLPSIADASVDVAEFAQQLAGMSDEGKKTLINVAGGVIAVGAATKGIAGGIKTVGGVIEGWGKIKDTKVFEGISTAFAAIPAPAKLAVAGIAAVGVASKVAYDAWYDSQYRWSEELSEGNEKIQESLEKYKSLNDIQGQIKSLKLVIENPDSSKEQVDEAKEKLEKIKELLSEEYDLVINSDNSDLDDAVETAKNMSKADLMEKMYTQMVDLNDLQPKFDSYNENKAQLEKQAQAALEAKNKYAELKLEMLDLKEAYSNTGDMDTYRQGLVGVAEQLGITIDKETELSDILYVISQGKGDNVGLNGLQKQGEEYENLTTKINDLIASYEEYITISKEMIGYGIELVNIAAQEGDTNGMQKQVERIKSLIKNAGLSMKDYAQAIEEASGGAIKASDLIAESINDIPDEHNTEITAEDKTAEGVDAAKENIKSVKDKEVIITVREKVIPSQFSGTNFGKFGANTFEFAEGTQNAPEGLAVVNDQKGIADNRELIVDRGRAFIPEGRNVILPLSKGAKVYTASQTQAIMRGLGIPHYASGKNNSDAFTLARDNWNHYTRTNSVTTAQELEKWLEFQEQYKNNEKDIWDIEEQIFSLQQKLYSERVRESEKWLAHETKYNGMSTADYLAGIDRMKAYTAEYYAQGIISHEEYNDALFELDEKYLDKRKEQLEEMYEASKAYISEHTYFNDWSDNGDDPLSAYNRVKDRQLEALKNGDLTQEEYDKYMSELGRAMLSERTEQSMNWLDEQRKYFAMSDEEYVAGLERIKQYTQQYYDEGLINRREYNEAMTSLNHSMWDEAASAYDEMLSKQQEYISDLRQQFSDEEQALRDSWTVEDRKIDIADVSAQLDIYAGAVTDRGQAKYKELQEQMKQLQREEELYQLEVANNAVIEKLEAEYEQLEADKAEYLKGIAQNTNIDVSGIVGDLTADIQSTGSDITSLLSQILGAFSNFKVEAPTYTDNKQVIFNEADKETIMAILMKNVGLTT